MKLDLWIDASRLQALVSQLDELVDNSWPKEGLRRIQLLKQKADSFVTEQAQHGNIPDNPLPALELEFIRAQETAQACATMVKEADWPLEQAFLSDNQFWSVHDGFQQAVGLAIPNPDFWRNGKGEQSISAQAHIKDLTALAAGGYHCLALRQNGAIYGWGQNGWNQATQDSESRKQQLATLKARTEEGESNQLIHTFQGHTDTVYKVGWSPDGKHLASCSADKTVKVWEVASGNLLHTLQGHTGSVYEVGWSPDGQWLASCSSDKTVKVWEAASGRELLTLQGHTLQEPMGSVRSLGWSPDGKRLASGGGGINMDESSEAFMKRFGEVHVWEAASGKLLHALQGHTDEVSKVAWSPDGKHLASGSDDKTVKVWDGGGNVPLSTPESTGSKLESWVSSVVGSGDSPVPPGDRGKELTTLQGHTEGVSNVAWSPDGKLISSCGWDAVRVWDAARGELLHTLQGHTAAVTRFAWSPDGKLISSCSEDKTVKVWEAASGNLLHTLQGHTGSVHEVGWSPDGQWLASCSSDKTVKVWETASGRELLTLQGHTHRVIRGAWSPDGKLIASCSLDKTVKVWDPRPIEDLLPPPESINAESIAAGDWHGLALKNDGTVVGWGNNDHGQATPPESLQRAKSPDTEAKPSLATLAMDQKRQRVTALAAGCQHSLALLRNDTVMGWGNNGHGQADPPEGLQDVVAIAAGGNHSLALLENETVVGWGNNGLGQASPPEGLQDVVAIAAGTDHSLALLHDGTVVGWGSNTENQAEPPADLRDAKAIAAGGYHSLALLQNGTVVGWGNNDYGQAIPPETESTPESALPPVLTPSTTSEPALPPMLTPSTTPDNPPIIGESLSQSKPNTIAISAGKCFSVALKDDGTYSIWGHDISGSAPPHGMPGFTPFGFSTQREHSMAFANRLAATSSENPKLSEYEKDNCIPYVSKLGLDEEAANCICLLRHQGMVKGRERADQLLEIMNQRLRSGGDLAPHKEWLKELCGQIKESWASGEFPPERLVDVKGDFKPYRFLYPGSYTVPGWGLNNKYFGDGWDEIQKLKEGSGPIHERLESQLEQFANRLDAARAKVEWREKQAPKLAGIAFILVNQAMWNFDGISQSEYQLMLDMMKDWDRRLGMQLGQSNMVRLVQWAINKWNEDAQTESRKNYQAIVGNLSRLNRFERPIVPVQLHKLGDLDGGITAEQLQFIHDIEAYLNTEGLVAEEDEALMNTDEAVCYILLVMALWDEDGFTEQEQGAVAEIMGNFSIGLPQDTLVKMLEESVQRYNQDSDAGEIAHLEECVARVIAGLDDTWKKWCIDSLRYLAEVGGTTDQQQNDFLALISKQLGVEKEPEKAAA